MQEEDLEYDVMSDDGCPNCPERHDAASIVRRFPSLGGVFARCEEEAKSFHRQHRVVLHLTTISLIIISLVIEGTIRPTDWLFVTLSLLCEVSQ